MPRALLKKSPTAGSKVPTKFMQLKVTQLQVQQYTKESPDGYQRPLNAKWAKRVTKVGIDYSAFGALLVGRREDGKYYVVDGQQRLNIAKEAGWVSVPCMVFESKGPKHEAEVFIKTDDRKKLSVRDLFNAALIAKESWAISMLGTCNSFGFQITVGEKGAGSHGWGNLNCLGTLVHVHTQSNNLKMVLKVIIEAWPNSATAMRNEIIKGLSMFFTAYGEGVDEKRLINVLSKKTADGLLTLSVQLAPQFGSHGSSKYAGVVQAIVDTYNKRLGEGKLSHLNMMRSAGLIKDTNSK